ncbi:hypothetical protein SAMN05444161_3727 [Rhizobiales bacterium GAS191]|jgi:hypothetical protein|nr:hypothetical protein SAMN05519103_02876 [Rhizobiales bacterium GAS113]SED67776.1 hypothetical protein SAMN05444161_3727 [Rhizobiales bacterium GAS191]SEE73904.1 hypothetical protein SAMN05519104_7285 [Rhizobiales bacterium GAS188]
MLFGRAVVAAECPQVVAASRRLISRGRTNEPYALGAALRHMSNKTFLIIWAVIFAVLVGSAVIRKFEACLERGGEECPIIR